MNDLVRRAIKDTCYRMIYESPEQSREFHHSINSVASPHFQAIMGATIKSTKEAPNLVKVYSILSILLEIGIRVGMRVSELNKERNNATTLQSDT